MSDSSPYRPDGFHDLTPYLVVAQGKASALMVFLERAFGAVERLSVRAPDGRLVHAQLSLGDSVLELGESPGHWTSRVSLHFYVTEIDKVHARAIGAGGKELLAPVDQEYGERSSGIEDPCGNHWYLATRLS